ncbi:MAG: coenzyme A pyrophosphatase [Rhodospirillaceae bacterium]|nr:coenzyme A pyrophosphatase [Rhodospirillaceae bacterium]
MTYPFDNALRRALLENIDGFKDRRGSEDGLRHAAVSIVVVGDGDEAAFLLTKRSPRLNAHSGQFALPGGRVDEGETALEAALREMREEINVSLTSDHLVGMLDDYPTRSGYRITPFVFWAGEEIKPEANPREVAIIYKVPFRELAHPETPEFASIPESDRPLIRLNIVNTQVHAPTAAVIYQFREVGIFGRDTRVEHLEQPVWAWS